MLVDASNKIRLILTQSELFGIVYCVLHFFPILLSNIIKKQQLRLNVSVISCLVEMCSQTKNDNDQFKQINYHVHILKPICPNPNKNLTENSLAMTEQDYSQKKQPMNPLIILS